MAECIIDPVILPPSDLEAMELFSEMFGNEEQTVVKVPLTHLMPSAVNSTSRLELRLGKLHSVLFPKGETASQFVDGTHLVRQEEYDVTSQHRIDFALRAFRGKRIWYNDRPVTPVMLVVFPGTVAELENMPEANGTKLTGFAIEAALIYATPEETSVVAAVAVGSPESAATQFCRGPVFLEAFPTDLQELWQQSHGEGVTSEEPDKAELAAPSDTPAGNLTHSVRYRYRNIQICFIPVSLSLLN
jgi:hypothetical protein